MMVVLRTLPKVFQPIAPEHFERLCHECGTESTPFWRRDELGSMHCNICYFRRFSKSESIEESKLTKEQREFLQGNRIAAQRARERKKLFMASSEAKQKDEQLTSFVAIPPVQQGQEQTSTTQETPELSSNAPQETSVERAETLDEINAEKTAEIFQGLDEIDWSTLKSCYGLSPDVPKWLRELRSPSCSIRNKAYKNLEDNLYHQGTSYEASFHAIPFLLRLIADKETPERGTLIEFLISLAIGFPDDSEPSRFNVMNVRGIEKNWRDADIDEVLGKEEEKYEGENDVRRKLLEGQRHEILSGTGCYNAVCAGVPIFLSLLLDDEDLAVRVVSAYAVAWFPERARLGENGIIPALMRLIDSGELHPSIISSALLAAGSLVASSVFLLGSKEEADDPSIVDLLQRKFSNEDEAFAIRWAAAKSLVDLEREDGDIMLFMANSLLKAEGGGAFDTDIPPFGVTDLYGGSMRALKSYLRRNEGNSASAEVIRTLVCGGLSQSSAPNSQFFADLTLTLVFHGSKPPPHPTLPSFEQLDEKQQMVVRGLADMSDEVWDDIWFSGACRQRGLPGTRADCLDYTLMGH